MQNPKVTKITLPMNSVQEAVQYWLENIVFKELVDVKNVLFSKHSESFTVNFVTSEREAVPKK